MEPFLTQVLCLGYSFDLLTIDVDALFRYEVSIRSILSLGEDHEVSLARA